MLLKEFTNDKWSIYKSTMKDGTPYLETANGCAWTVTDNGTFWIESLQTMPPPDRVYNAMIKLGRELLGNYSYD